MKFNFALVAITLCVLGSCKKDTEVVEPPAFSYLMIYNGSPEYFGQNSTALVNNQSFGPRSYNENGKGLVGAFNFSHYNYIDTGNHRLAFTDSAYHSQNGKKLSEAEMIFHDRQHYTIYLTDSLGFYEILYTHDDIVPHSEKALLRLVHLSPDAGKVSLSIDTNAIESISNIDFKQVTEYAPIDPDIKPGIRIMYDDKETGDKKTLIRKSFPLEAGKCYTMILRGYKMAPDGNVNKTINLSTITNF